MVAKAQFAKGHIVSENSDEARELLNRSSFGVKKVGGRVTFSPLEALYLTEKGRLIVSDKKELDFDALYTKVKKLDKDVAVRYPVFRDLRDRGYVVKTALKFGVAFRVYDKGIKPGQDHAKWIVYPVTESSGLKWYEFSAHNRVAHSTRKKLLVAVVDDEQDIVYFETAWIRP